MGPLSGSTECEDRWRPVSRPRAVRRACRAGGEHLIHVGYHKTASTWLQVCVFPYLAGVRYGDPLFDHLVTNLATADDRTFFAEAFRSVLRQIDALAGGPLLLSNEGIRGTLWNVRDTGFRNAERLRGLMPRARIVLVVRRQDEMLRSVHAQYVNEGGTRPLREFVERGVEGCRFSLRHLEYDRLAGCYVDLFGQDRVWIVPYEHLRAQREEFLDGLCEFLGAELTVTAARARLNHSLSCPSLWLLRTWNRLFRASRFNQAPSLASLPGGRRVRNFMQERLDPFVCRVAGRTTSAADGVLLADIAARFAQSNGRLQRFCSQPLATWGYPLPLAAPGRGV